MIKKDTGMIHQDDKETFKRASDLAFRLAACIGERLAVFEAKRRPLEDGAEGLCYVDERRISIMFRKKNRAGDGGAWYAKPIPERHVMDAVAHEVAHLRHPNHSAEFKALERELKSLI